MVPIHALPILNLGISPQLHSLLRVFSEDAESIHFFQAGDRQRLYRHNQAAYASIKQLYDITHFYFFDLNRVVVLRVHNPDRHGDQIDRYTTLQAEQTGEMAYGMELGPQGAMTLRVVIPWYHEGKRIGYLELGKEINTLFNGFQRLLRFDFYTLLKKSLLDKPSWEASMGRAGAWERFPNHVLAGGSTLELPANIDTFLRHHLPLPEAYTTTGGDSHAHLFNIPLIDATGNEVGLLLGVINERYSSNLLDTDFFPFFVCLLFSVVGFFWLIKKNKDMRRSLKRSLLNTERATRTKSDFLANMSHEIRSPLNAIIGLTDLVQQAQLTREEELTSLQIVHANSLHLLELINATLDLSKIEAGYLTLESIPFDLVGRLEEVVTTLANRAHKKGLGFYHEVAAGLPQVILGDPVRVKQILVNLAGNAIKFTQQGEVVIRVKPAAGSADPTGTIMLQFSVSDTGIGVAQEKLHHLFQSFVQADSSISRRYGGTGLGLTISQHLAEMMGGKIEVDSEEGKGSVFTFTGRFKIGRRLAPSHHEQAAPSTPERRKVEHPPACPLQGVRILLGEVSPTAQQIIKDILVGFSAQVTAVGTTQQLAAQFDQAAEQEQPFEVIILDEKMARANLEEELSPVHHAGLKGKTIILKSSHIANGNVTRPDFLLHAILLNKPARKFGILRRINRILGRTPEERAGSTQNALGNLRKSSNPLDILVVDDLPENQRLASSILGSAAHRVVVADGGMAALALLRQKKFDLVLMDLMMPEMDGYETTRRIRQATSGEVLDANVPIIAVSARGKQERTRCLEAGMNAFLGKPYLVEQLLSVVARYQKQDRESKKELVLKPVNVDPQELATRKSRFVTEAPTLVLNLGNRLEAQDMGEVVQAATALRALASAIGATRIASDTLRLIGHVEILDWQEGMDSGQKIRKQVEECVAFLCADSDGV
jgi:signal transduction histidine kinase/DNA-binding response OmpR family regulator